MRRDESTRADLLLDTCAAIWIANQDRLREPALSELPRALDRGSGLLLSPMTAWEFATLAAKGKLAAQIAPEVWFSGLCQLPGVALAELSPSVLIASASLPGAPPRDPVDRILLATARQFGYALVTRDRNILDYGRSGNVRVLAC